MGAGNNIGVDDSNSLEINATTLNASTDGAIGDDIFIDDLGGGVMAGLVTAGNGNVDLDVVNGSLTSEVGDLDTADVVGTLVDLTIIGAGTIGASDALSLEIDSALLNACLLYTSPSPRDGLLSRMPSSA